MKISHIKTLLHAGKRLAVACIVSLLLSQGLFAQEISRSFEFRYFTEDAEANGETDFKGETEIFSTSERVEFLSHYADYAKQFFNDPKLNKEAANDKAVSSLMDQLKAQPLPQVRTRKRFSEWKWMGYKEGQREEESEQLAWWKSKSGTHIENHSLVFNRNARVTKKIRPQSWRFSFQWKVRVGNQKALAFLEMFNNEEKTALTAGFNKNGRFFYTTDSDTIHAEHYEKACWYTLKVEVDLKNHRYNFYVDDKQVAEFVELQTPATKQVPAFSIFATGGTKIKSIWGLGYFLTGETGGPFYPETFIDEDFTLKPCMENWNKQGYNDSLWQSTDLPKVHGGERHAKEDLYLRKKVYVGGYQRAVLNAEMLDPGGAIWVNGELMYSTDKRYPIKKEVGEYLHKNDTNLIAIKVNDFINPDKSHWHPPQDPYIGWYAGRVWLDLTSNVHIADVFSYTKDISDPARQQVNVKINNVDNPFEGFLQVNCYPWYPDEQEEPSDSETFKISLQDWQKEEFEKTLSLADPELWTAGDPNLYKIEVILQDENRQPVDDYVITTGIRTISQKGGTFRVNGRPSMLNGAQIFGFRSPIEKLAKWARCAPKDWLVREIAQIKNMNGNLMRIHNHAWAHNPPARNINDPRLAEIGDQLGMMFIWATPSWTRGEAWGIDFKGLPEYITQVRNHPSIVMWEASNHPWDGLNNLRNSNRFCKKIYDAVYSVDSSRIVSYASHVQTLVYGNDEGTVNQEGKPITPAPEWTAPNVTRGNQISITGYGKEWNLIREFPDEYHNSFLKSRERAYFNFEHEESIGQPNWNLVKGKPWYRMQSYEWGYDEGSIGRRLEASEWEESQAWQALSAWESMKRQRIMDIDGFSWCSLHGGPNNVTYKKPLIDYMGHAKLAYHINKMLFQNTVGASAGVDVVYGPEDTLTPVVMNLGSGKTVRLTVNIYDMNHNLVQQKEYQNIELQEGRTVTKLDSFLPEAEGEGYYGIEYIITKQK
ncbi:MAG: glycosyl hydrolase family 2 [Bacteroidales bacterium]|nr:glycosyl hydrolase family 2 [Bacteroidales bacterium]